MGLHSALIDLDLYLLNSGAPTRIAERPGYPDTVIDLTLASAGIKDRTKWKTGHHVGSDHLLCRVSISYCLTRPALRKRRHPYHGINAKGIWGSLRTIAKEKRGPRPPMKRSNAPDWWTPEVDTAWTNKNSKDRAFTRVRESGIRRGDGLVDAKIERNRATAQYKKAAAEANRRRWDRLCEQSNLTTTQFWNFHRSLDRRCANHNVIMYDDDDNILVTVEDQGKAFLDRFIKQSDHNDGDTRSYLLDQLGSMVKQAETDTDFTLSEVMSAICTTKNGAPGPDGVDIEVFKGLDPELKLELNAEYNKSWRTGEIP